MSTPFLPQLATQIEELRKRGFLIEDAWQGSEWFPLVDRFVIQIPYCSTKLNWTCLYNPHDPTQAPDFIVEKGHELLLDLQDIRSLDHWDPDNKLCLLTIVMELREAFKVANERKVAEFPSERLQFEYQTLQGTHGLECLVVENEEQTQVRCSVPLHFDVDILPKSNDGKPSLATLSVVFWPLNESKTPTVHLHYGKELASILDRVTAPSWSNESCVMEIVATVMEKIQQEVKTKTEGASMRKEYVQTLVLAYGCPQEYDDDYRKITFLFEVNKFPLFVIFAIPQTFPTERPFVTLQAVLPSKGNVFKEKTLTELPYSPRWPAIELQKRWHASLIDVINRFRKECE